MPIYSNDNKKTNMNKIDQSKNVIVNLHHSYQYTVSFDYQARKHSIQNNKHTTREIELGGNVLVRGYDGNQEWYKCIVKKRVGNVIYLVNMKNGTEWKDTLIK